MNSKLEILIANIDDDLGEDAVYLSKGRANRRGFETFDPSSISMLFMIFKMLYESMFKGIAEGFGHGLGKGLAEGSFTATAPAKLQPPSKVEDAGHLDELFVRVCELGGSMSNDRLSAFLQGGKRDLQKYFEDEKGVPKDKAARMAEVYTTAIQKVLKGDL